VRDNNRTTKLLDALLSVDIFHKLSKEEKVCDSDGNPITEIGEVISEQLDFIPTKILVIWQV